MECGSNGVEKAFYTCQGVSSWSRFPSNYFCNLNFCGSSEFDQHAFTLFLIIVRRMPLTENTLFRSLRNILRRQS